MNPDLPKYESFQNQNVQPTESARVDSPNSVHSAEYISNPFKVTLLGLGNMLQRNWLSTLTVLPRILQRVLIFIIVMVVLGILAAIVGHVLVSIVILIGAIGLIYIAILTYAATTAVQSASQDGVSITGKQAVHAFDQKKLLSLGVASILSGIIVSVGFVLLIVPGLIFLARLSLVPFVIYHENLKAVAAMKRSWQLTRGHVWEILGIHAAQLITISGSGGLLAFSGGSAGLAKSYKQLDAYTQSNTPTGPVHRANYILVILLGLFIPLYIGGIAAIQYSSNQAANKRGECALTTTYTKECEDVFKNTPNQLQTPNTTNDSEFDGNTLTQ